MIKMILFILNAIIIISVLLGLFFITTYDGNRLSVVYGVFQVISFTWLLVTLRNAIIAIKGSF